eukprot:864401-Rhodomonas_salina.1
MQSVIDQYFYEEVKRLRKERRRRDIESSMKKTATCVHQNVISLTEQLRKLDVHVQEIEKEGKLTQRRRKLFFSASSPCLLRHLSTSSSPHRHDRAPCTTSSISNVTLRPVKATAPPDVDAFDLGSLLALAQTESDL